MVNPRGGDPATTRATLMDVDNDQYNRYNAVIAALNHELDWNLSTECWQQYIGALASLVQADAPEQHLRAVVQHYHSDHQRVSMLCDPTHPQHDQAWAQLTKDIARILRTANLAWSSDHAVDREDFTQIACAETAEKLPTFRFKSKFTTWLTTVVVHRVQRSVRDSLAQKRAVRPDSLEHVEDTALPEDNSLEDQVSAQLLLEKISDILQRHHNPLVLKAFLQRFYHDRPTKAIGELLSYHPSRIRALLAEAKQLLQQDPSLRDWLEDQRDRDDPGSV